MPAEPQMQVTSGADRPTQRQQIAEILDRVTQQGAEVVRARIPFSLYDHHTSRQYVPLRDATWTLALPVPQFDVDGVERLIQTLGKCIVAIAAQGPEKVLLALQQLDGNEAQAGVEVEQP